MKWRICRRLSGLQRIVALATYPSIRSFLLCYLVLIIIHIGGLNNDQLKSQAILHSYAENNANVLIYFSL